MVTAEIRINGTLLGHIYAVNDVTLENGQSLYHWECYVPDRGPLVGGTELRHRREDGALALISKIIEAAKTKGLF